MYRISSILLLLTIISCSTEKVNLSPVSDSFENGEQILSYNSSESFGETTRAINYASELSNLMSTFPKFNNDAVNREVNVLKKNANDYLLGVKTYNMRLENDALYQLKKSYQKLQKLKKYLNTKESEVLNRYMVRVKTTLSMLESSTNNQSDSLNTN